MILGRLTLKLTREQTREVRKLWDQAQAPSGSAFVLAQVAVKVGPFYVEPAQADVFIVDGAGFDAMQRALKDAAAPGRRVE
jgi:hypothetical protein